MSKFVQVVVLVVASLVVPAFLLALPVSSIAQEKSNPANVFAEVAHFRAELGEIRRIMGSVVPPTREYQINNADERHMFSQAQTLFRKANGLAQAVTGIARIPAPVAPDADINSADVLAVVTDARGQLALVMEELEIGPVQSEVAAGGQTASDVVKSLVDAGRDLNWTVGGGVGWETIYGNVLTAIAYVGGALGEESRYPALPTFEEGKSPGEVFGRLARCMALSREPADTYGIPVITMEATRQSELGPTAIEVNDLLNLIISDLAELTLRMDAEEVAAPDYEQPRRIFPSHVYQLVGVLEYQLAVLAENS